MTELDCIRNDVNKLNARLRREENYQSGVCRGYSKPLPIEDGDLHRLQQNLAEIRKELGCTGNTQETTMTTLRYKLSLAHNLQKLINKLEEQS